MTLTETPPTGRPTLVSRPAGLRSRVLGRLRSRDLRQLPLLLGLLVVIGYFALGPVLYLLNGTLVSNGSLSFAHVREAMAAPGVSESMRNTVVFAVGSGVFATLLGGTLAFLVARTDMPFKSLVTAVGLIPLIIPGVVHTICWMFLASPRIGVLNRWVLEPILGRPFDIQSILGMIFVQGLHVAPMAFLILMPAFRAMDPSLEEAAQVAGARVSRQFATVTMPMVRPGLYAALLISVVNGIEGFDVPLILGAPKGIHVLSTETWFALQNYPPDYGRAGSYALVLIVVSVLGAFAYARLSRKGKRFQTITGKGYRPREFELGPFKWVGVLIVFGYFFLAVGAPTLILVYASTQRFYSVPTWDRMANATWANYEQILTDDFTLHAVKNSVIFSTVSATVTMFLMALAAWVVVRSRLRGRSLLDVLAFLPIALPGVVVAVALIFIYLRSPLPIYGTAWILLIGFLTRYMPYGMRYASSSVHQISTELEEVSETSGARWWQTFRRIDLPLLAPGLLGGWIFIVVAVVRELSMVIVLYSPGNEMLSLLIYSQYSDGIFGVLAATGVLMIAILVVLVLLSLLVARRAHGQLQVRGL